MSTVPWYSYTVLIQSRRTRLIRILVSLGASQINQAKPVPVKTTGSDATPMILNRPERISYFRRETLITQ